MTAIFEDISDRFNFLNQAASSSFQNALNRADAWDNNLVNTVGNSINSRFSIWLTNHPFWGWLVHHPVISFVGGLVSLVLIIRLLVTIYNGIATTIDRIWLVILRSPFSLLKLLFGWEVKPKTDQTNTTITNYEVTNNPEQLQQILTRLDSIQKQQQQIVQDLKDLKQRSPHIEAKEVNLTLPTTKESIVKSQ